MKYRIRLKYPDPDPQVCLRVFVWNLLTIQGGMVYNEKTIHLSNTSNLTQSFNSFVWFICSIILIFSFSPSSGLFIYVSLFVPSLCYSSPSLLFYLSLSQLWFELIHLYLFLFISLYFPSNLWILLLFTIRFLSLIYSKSVKYCQGEESGFQAEFQFRVIFFICVAFCINVQIAIDIFFDFEMMVDWSGYLVPDPVPIRLIPDLKHWFLSRKKLIHELTRTDCPFYEKKYLYNFLQQNIMK